MAYELGTAQTMDSAVQKFQDLSQTLPDALETIESVIAYNAEEELIAVGENSTGDREWHRSINGGEKWLGPFWTHFGEYGNDVFETRDGTLLFTSGGGTVYRYTGGGETPTSVLDTLVNTYQQPFTQTDDAEIYVAEYDAAKTNNTAKIFKSTDDGQTWSQVVDLYDTPVGTEHLHGITSQGTDRLFVITGDTDHALLESNDEFATFNEWRWNVRNNPDDISYTGVVCENNHLILGADHIPSRITKLWVGPSYGDIPTDPDLDGGDVPTSMFHVMFPPEMGAETSAGSTYQVGRQRNFVHRLDTDGVMQYGHTVRNNILCISTNNGGTWKFIPTPIAELNDLAIASDSVYLSGEVGNQPRLLRVPKLALWDYPEPTTQTYHLLYQETVGQSSSSGNRTPVGKGLPFHLWETIRIGIETDGAANVDLFEDGRHGNAPAQYSDNGTIVNKRVSQSVTAGQTFIENTIPNQGFELHVLDQESAAAVTTSLFVQAWR